MNKFNNLDDATSVFFSRQLEYVKSKTYDVKYGEFKARTLIPVSFEADPGDQFIVYDTFDQVGIAKIISNFAKDLPRADVKGKQNISPIRSIGASYGYNINEIRAAARNNTDLKTKKANAAKRAVLQKENDIGLRGDTDFGLNGLINNPNISEYVLPADGSGSSKLWSSKSVDLILRDLNSMVSKVVNDSKGIEKPDTLLLPLDAWQTLSQLKLGTASDTTILDFWLKTNGFIKNVDWLTELSTAGVGGTRRMIAYVRDPDHLTLEIPQDFEAFDPQQEGLEWVVPCHARCGGVIVYYPLSIVFADGF